MVWDENSVSNLWQNFKTQVSGSWEKKSRKTRVFQVLIWMPFWVINTQYHCEITTVGPCAIC